MPLAPRSGSALAEWLSALAEDAELGRSIRHHALLPPAEPDLSPELRLDDALRPLLAARRPDGRLALAGGRSLWKRSEPQRL